MKFYRLVATFACLAAASYAVPAAAAVPASSHVEGILSSSGGGAAADGNYKVTFSLYKDETGGNPVWAESDVILAVKGGVFAYNLGSKSPLSQQVLTDLGGKGWLGLKVEADPELARRPLGSVVYALRAGAAEGIDCSGCIKATHLDAGVFGGFAKTADLAKVAVTGDFADLKGGPDLSAYAKSASLAKVATSGAFADLTGGPDLSAYAKLASLADVAKSGNYADLKGIPTLAKVASTGEYADLKNPPVAVKVGASCGTGLVIKGIKADGTHECVLAMDPASFPPDAIDEVSNKLIHNQFVDSQAGTPNVDIKDGFLFGVADSLQFPDIGIAQKLNVSVHLTNSNIAFITVSLFDPAGVEHLLYDKGGTGTTLKTSYPDPTKQLAKDLTTWVGKNPKGQWTLKVVDSGAATGGALDGKIVAWSIDIQTLSSKKIQVKGELLVDGGVKLGTTAACDVNKVGTLRWDSTWGQQVCDRMYDNKGVASYEWIAAIARKPMFSGGCKYQPSGQDGWARYCLDGTDFNTAGDYMNVSAGDGVITIKVSGFYRFNMFSIQHGCGSKHFRFYINGSQRGYWHNNDTDSGANWSTQYGDLTWPLRKGDQVWWDAHANGCNAYRWHHWDTPTAHSRLQAEFVGRWGDNSTATF